MNRFTKNLILNITVLSLCTALTGFHTIYADESGVAGYTELPATTRAPTQEEEPSATAKPNRKLYVDFMGRGETPLDASPSENSKLTSADENSEFWVGVAVDKANDLDLFKDGVYSLELAFEYDPTYIVPFYETGDPNTGWAENIKKGSFGDSNSSLVWNSSQYDIISVASTSLDTTSDRENKGLLSKRTNWKMCTVCVTFKENTAFENVRFLNLAEDTKQYLLRLPFKLVHAPAEEDVNKNPLVLSLVRGPETFNIGSDANGVTPYSAWEATVTDPNDQTNLKNLFDGNGDIYLFGDAVEGGITDVKGVPVTAQNPEATANPEATEAPEATDMPLSRTTELLGEGFDPDVTEYYLSVSNDVKNLSLKITSESTESPQVTANGNTVTVNLDESLYLTDLFGLSAMNKDTANGGEENGFNNTVVITDGSKEYTIHIRQLYKPKIELNYGNSPVGMIMRDNVKYPDITAKETAIQNFKDTRIFSDVSNNLTYYVDAWSTYAEKYAERDEHGEIISLYDGDLDPTALFVFQRKPFKDPGFKLYDGEGELVTDADVINSVKLTLSMNSYKGGFASYTEADNVKSISADENAKGNNYVFDDFVKLNIRPDIYELTYSFKDPKSSTTVTETRKIMAISRHGDVSIDVNNTLQGADSTEITTHITVFASPKMNSLYKFRIADTDINVNKTIQGADATVVKTNIATGLPEFYKEINNEE